MIAENLKQVKLRIDSVRHNQQVQLIAVSKARSVCEIQQAVDAGQMQFGENYVQESLDKIEVFEGKNLIWHFIGPIQSNKTASIAEKFDWVHSIERFKIAKRLNDQRHPKLGQLKVLLQINIDREKTKSGFFLEDIVEIIPEIKKLIENNQEIKKEYKIENTNRAVGTRISHHLYNKYGDNHLEENSIQLYFKGSAGQSFGAFGVKGLKLNLKGDANDYVGKGLSGGTIVITLRDESNLTSNENTIIGNTVLYGATSGSLYAAGQAGERFAVRNSGAKAVIEGCDSNGCEYMTGGNVVILGEVGDNFAAGMTGGMAFVYDLSNKFEKKVNPESVVWQRLETEYWKSFLKDLISIHVRETNSSFAKKILENYENEIINFFQVCPKEMLDKLDNPITLKKNLGIAS